ncbi:MAG: glutamate--cysteine ligase [Gammaproteobacteria bacterium]|nr:glutamate--cysteine ligase [Gammaproteobacteria bacterium]
MNHLETTFEQRLSMLLAGDKMLPRGGKIGIERETLRVTETGGMSAQRHPKSLGATLTHAHIMTDYAEPMLELVTDPHDSVDSAVAQLDELTRFVYQNIGDETLWPHSMPCVLGDEANIPIAEYGDSGIGQFKHLYRVGLAHRYGRTMQVISGVHFNMSLPSEAWQRLYPDLPADEARNTGYFVALRNLQRIGWMVPYLFGSSPAACRSMARGRATALMLQNGTTLVGPDATSLRLGDMGYNNADKRGYSFKANYSSIEDYIQSLKWAVSTPREDFEVIGLEGPEGPRQLSANHLQIENEYYASVRPKQPVKSGETPLLALKRRGVEYLEVRSLDVNPWFLTGVDPQALKVIECLVWLAALDELDEISSDEHAVIEDNWRQVAHYGRKANVELKTPCGIMGLNVWAKYIGQQLLAVAKCLGDSHVEAVEQCVIDVLEGRAEPLSAKWLEEMGSDGFFCKVMAMAKQHQQNALSAPLDPERLDALRTEAAQSLEAAEQTDGRMLNQIIEDYTRTWEQV